MCCSQLSARLPPVSVSDSDGSVVNEFISTIDFSVRSQFEFR